MYSMYLVIHNMNINLLEWYVIPKILPILHTLYAATDWHRVEYSTVSVLVNK